MNGPFPDGSIDVVKGAAEDCAELMHQATKLIEANVAGRLAMKLTILDFIAAIVFAEAAAHGANLERMMQRHNDHVRSKLLGMGEPLN